ncbi:MAG TPA: hypothetical protein VGF69_12695 [Thermoanaerobaculia bacterium]|jgi:hypothetical protein
MPLLLFAAFLALAVTVTFANWRHGLLLALVCGVLQDPVRKMTPGTPVVLTFSIIIIFAAVIVRAWPLLTQAIGDFSRRFPNIYLAGTILLFLLVLAAINGLLTFGVRYWKVPLLSLFTYLAPIPAVLVGYVYLQREEMLYRFLRVYAAITSLALVGTVLEYLRFQLPFLGMVATEGDQIRHLPGIQIRMLSGIYRAPDIMGWHAATLTAIGIAMAIRGGLGKRAWPWMSVAAWGFFCCMISGRRKAVYFVAAFAGAFLWRYFRRLKVAQLIAIGATGLIMGGIIYQLKNNEESSVYAQGAAASRSEIAERLEGGVFETFRQFGLMGAGLGTATQGMQHLLPEDATRGWQEGGLGKIAVELGLPGIFGIMLFGAAAGATVMKLTRIGDVPGSSQVARAMLFALVAANGANFLASAQAYTDPVLSLVTALFAGFLLATATLDERLAREQTAAQPQPLTASA